MGFSPLHLLILLVVGGFCLAIPVTVVLLVLIFARQRPSDPNINSPAGSPGVPMAPLDSEQQTRQWAMFLHFSQLAAFLVPLAGLIVPIVIWQIKKTELPGIDVHGKIVINWIISEVLYGFVSFILLF